MLRQIPSLNCGLAESLDVRFLYRSTRIGDEPGNGPRNLTAKEGCLIDIPRSLMRMDIEETAEKRITCPKCASLALYRFGHVRSGLQRYICLMCGRQFIPGHERLSPMLRPTCDRCGAGMHLFKKRSAHTVFRCARYPACRRCVTVEDSLLLQADCGRGEHLPEAARE